MRLPALSVLLVLALLFPASASAAPPAFGGLTQLAAPDACLAGAALGGCTAVGGFGSATGIAITSGGEDVYTSGQTGRLRAFRRNAATGALTPNGLTAPAGESSFGVAVDPAGVFVLRASGNSGGQARISSFARGSDGVLGAAACAVENVAAGCTEVDGIAEARQVAIAPTGPGIYVAGAAGGGDGGDGDTDGDGALVTLQRNATFGSLSQSGCIPAVDSPTAGDACDDGAGSDTLSLGGVIAVEVSPDGRHVYAGGFSGLVGFNRSATTGDLSSVVTCLRRTGGVSNCPDDDRILITEDIAISPDGTSVYAAARDRVVVYSRQPLSGALAFVECINDNPSECTVGAPGLGFSVEGVAVSPDSRTVYLASRGGDSVRAFRRDPATGKLSQFQCLAFTVLAGCDPGAGLKGTRAVVPSPDGRHVHIASYEGTGSGDSGALSSFHASLAPTCSGGSVTVAAGSTVAVPLTCSDANGDALTRTVSSAPASGVLGAIDQAAGTVPYTAPAATGAQSVGFSASDGTNSSVSATVTIDVTPAAAPPPPTPPASAATKARSRIATIAKRVKASKLKRFGGTASGSVRRVELSLVRLQGGARISVARCQALGSKGTLRALKPSRGRCKASGYLGAKGTTRWSFTLKRALSPGTYVLTSRATSTSGAKETVFSSARGNRRTFTVR